MRNFPLAASLLLALSPLALTTALAAQDAPAAEATTEAPTPALAFEVSDVPVDTGYTFGQLPNGMRYIIRQNATPAGTALVRMRIIPARWRRPIQSAAFRTILNTWPSTDRRASLKAR